MLLIEAAWQGIRRSPTLKAYYDRIMQGKKERRKTALVATANHLLRVMAAMLRSGEVWREDERWATAEATAGEIAGVAAGENTEKIAEKIPGVSMS